jgi:AAA family ATP:ADP antiporter
MMTASMPSEPINSRPPNLFIRILALKPAEYVAVSWSFVYFFCVLSAYYILRPVRETMAVGSGPNTIPWLFFGTFVTMVIVTPVFGWVASRYPRKQFLPWVYLFFISNILIFWVVFSIAIDSQSDHIWLGRAFFVWLSVFNLFVVSVFWSFMADIYTREQGRRLFGVITAGGSIGALIGGGATSYLVERIGFQNLFLIAASLLLVAIFCITRLRNWVAQSHSDDLVATAASNKPLLAVTLSPALPMYFRPSTSAALRYRRSSRACSERLCTCSWRNWSSRPSRAPMHKRGFFRTSTM